MDEFYKIRILVTGDDWCNQEEVLENLKVVPSNKSILFDTLHEGVSLTACGFIDFINAWLNKTGRDPDSIFIDTPNQYEKIPYQFAYSRPLSHFLNSHSVTYYSLPRKLLANSKLFGLFVGRYTAQRNIMVKDMLIYGKHFLFSVMHNDATDLNNPSTITYDQNIWNIGSIDKMKISDQFGSDKNTNSSLLSYYDQFQIEIAAETMTKGETFFPTEKTVRPIMGSKPFMIFATINFLKNLRDLGFKTFDTLWSEEYDRYEGIDRWNLIKKNIIGVIEHGYDREKAQEIVDYNYQHLINHFLSSANG